VRRVEARGPVLKSRAEAPSTRGPRQTPRRPLLRGGLEERRRTLQPDRTPSVLRARPCGGVGAWDGYGTRGVEPHANARPARLGARPRARDLAPAPP
jgi:hypothetical protein